MRIAKNYGVNKMSVLKRKQMELDKLADLENAVAAGEKNSIDIEDVVNAVLELGELIAEQEQEEE